MDDDFLGARGNADGSVALRINFLAVRNHVGYGNLKVRHLLHRFLDVHHRHAVVARDIQIAALRDRAERVGLRNARQAVVHVVKDRVDILAGEHVFRGKHIDTVTAEHPHLVTAVLVNIEVVRVRKILHRRYPVLRIHVCDGVAGHNPVDVADVVFFDAHHDVGLQAVLRVALYRRSPGTDDEDTAAVGAEDVIAVGRLFHCQDFDVVQVAFVRFVVVDAGDALPPDDNHTAGAGHKNRAVAALVNRAGTLLRKHAIRNGVAGEFMTVKANQRILAVRGKPQPFLAVADDGANADTLQEGNQVAGVHANAARRFRLGDDPPVHNRIAVKYREAVGRADPDTPAIFAGGIYHGRFEAVPFKNVGEGVRDNLHYTLVRGREPEIALVVRKHVVYGNRHRNLGKHLRFVVVHNADAAVRAHPEFAVEKQEGIDRCKRCVEGRVAPHTGHQVHVINLSVLGPVVYIARIVRVRVDRHNIRHILFRKVIKTFQRPLLERKQLPVLRDTVNHSAYLYVHHIFV